MSAWRDYSWWETPSWQQPNWDSEHKWHSQTWAGWEGNATESEDNSASRDWVRSTSQQTKWKQVHKDVTHYPEESWQQNSTPEEPASRGARAQPIPKPTDEQKSLYRHLREVPCDSYARMSQWEYWQPPDEWEAPCDEEIVRRYGELVEHCPDPETPHLYRTTLTLPPSILSKRVFVARRPKDEKEEALADAETAAYKCLKEDKVLDLEEVAVKVSELPEDIWPKMTWPSMGEDEFVLPEELTIVKVERRGRGKGDPPHDRVGVVVSAEIGRFLGGEYKLPDGETTCTPHRVVEEDEKVEFMINDGDLWTYHERLMERLKAPSLPGNTIFLLVPVDEDGKVDWDEIRKHTSEDADGTGEAVEATAEPWFKDLLGDLYTAAQARITVGMSPIGGLLVHKDPTQAFGESRDQVMELGKASLAFVLGCVVFLHSRNHHSKQLSTTRAKLEEVLVERMKSVEMRDKVFNATYDCNVSLGTDSELFHIVLGMIASVSDVPHAAVAGVVKWLLGGDIFGRLTDEDTCGKTPVTLYRMLASRENLKQRTPTFTMLTEKVGADGKPELYVFYDDDKKKEWKTYSRAKHSLWRLDSADASATADTPNKVLQWLDGVPICFLVTKAKSSARFSNSVVLLDVHLAWEDEEGLTIIYGHYGLQYRRTYRQAADGNIGYEIGEEELPLIYDERKKVFLSPSLRNPHEPNDFWVLPPLVNDYIKGGMSLAQKAARSHQDGEVVISSKSWTKLNDVYYYDVPNTTIQISCKGFPRSPFYCYTETDSQGDARPLKWNGRCWLARETEGQTDWTNYYSVSLPEPIDFEQQQEVCESLRRLFMERPLSTPSLERAAVTDVPKFDLGFLDALHKFQNFQLVVEMFTHTSALKSTSSSNGRLAFLGECATNLMVRHLVKEERKKEREANITTPSKLFTDLGHSIFAWLALHLNLDKVQVVTGNKPLDEAIKFARTLYETLEREKVDFDSYDTLMALIMIGGPYALGDVFLAFVGGLVLDAGWREAYELVKELLRIPMEQVEQWTGLPGNEASGQAERKRLDRFSDRTVDVRAFAPPPPPPEPDPSQPAQPTEKQAKMSDVLDSHNPDSLNRDSHNQDSHNHMRRSLSPRSAKAREKIAMNPDFARVQGRTERLGSSDDTTEDAGQTACENQTYWCDCCKMRMNSSSQWKAHVYGKKHRKTAAPRGKNKQ